MNPTEAERIHITMDPLAIVFLGTVAKTGTELRRLFLSRQYVDRISTSVSALLPVEHALAEFVVIRQSRLT